MGEADPEWQLLPLPQHRCSPAPHPHPRARESLSPHSPHSLSTPHQGCGPAGSDCSPRQPVWPNSAHGKKKLRYALETVTPRALRQSQNIPLCLAFIHGLEGKWEAFGQSAGARRPGKPAHQWFSNQRARWTKLGRAGMGAKPSQQGKGVPKGRNQGRRGKIQRMFWFCACVFALTQLSVGFRPDPLS